MVWALTPEGRVCRMVVMAGAIGAFGLSTLMAMKVPGRASPVLPAGHETRPYWCGDAGRAPAICVMPVPSHSVSAITRAGAGCFASRPVPRLSRWS